MKLHYFSSSSVISDRANAVHVIKMSRAFAHLGHKVVLHAKAGEGSEADVFRYYGVPAGAFELNRVQEDNSALTFVLTILKKKFPFLPLGGAVSLITGRAVVQSLDFMDTDLVYARNMYWAYCLPAEVPFIYEVHSPPQNIFQRFLEKRLMVRRVCVAIVVISQRLKDIYCKLHPELSQKIFVAHDGADDPGQKRIDRLSRYERPLTHVGYVGHLYQGRGIDTILAMAQARRDLTFHIVGGQAGPVNEMKKSGVPDNLILHGHQSQEDLPVFFEMFDIALAPYQGRIAIAGNTGDQSAHMSPLKIFEYMSWGLPILCSDLPVLREVLKPNHNAVLLPPDNLDAWLTALDDLARSPNQRRQIGQAARADLLSLYTWEQRANQLIGLIH